MLSCIYLSLACWSLICCASEWYSALSISISLSLPTRVVFVFGFIQNNTLSSFTKFRWMLSFSRLDKVYCVRRNFDFCVKVYEKKYKVTTDHVGIWRGLIYKWIPGFCVANYIKVHSVYELITRNDTTRWSYIRHLRPLNKWYSLIYPYSLTNFPNLLERSKALVFTDYVVDFTCGISCTRLHWHAIVIVCGICLCML